MSDKLGENLLLVINPVSGKKLAKKYSHRIIERFGQAGFNVTCVYTKIDENAYEIVRKRADEFDFIVCVGGDGTLKETVCGVIELKKDIPIGYIPMGSTNDFAHSLGIPTEIDKSIENIINGSARAVDMGVFGDNVFVYVAAFGNFTAISYSASQKLKNVLGKNAYYLNAVSEFFKMKGYHARIEADGEVFEGDYFYAEASNSYNVGGMPVLHNLGVRFDDGKHELVLVEMFKSVSDILGLVNDMIHKTVAKNKLVTFRHCDEIKFCFDEPTAFTLDGEFGGEQTDVTVKTLKHAVKIITENPLPVEKDSLLEETVSV